ncbi:MAG: hypothetical protein COT43_05065 [Candidatus Marinimicrobia bacterium CG08_land_8_20_14_0_20_45_22]|nr:MAG: hypothetical protein COT43_05065 [Candidatus Marinimicrobia bacterium CG08_land_8_20_14_0_20_45_22]
MGFINRIRPKLIGLIILLSIVHFSFGGDEPVIPENMSLYFMGIIRRGTHWTPESTPQIEELQKSHLENIQKMAETGQLVLAGPFIDDGDIRRIYIFKVNTMEDVRRLADTNPMVKAGRLVVEIHPWIIEKGFLP